MALLGDNLKLTSYFEYILDEAIRLLKRGLAATVDEFLMSAEYIMNEGNHRVVLCERGVRTFLNHTRFTLDVGAIPVIKETSHLPIIVDPSHAAGLQKWVIPLALAGVAAGADGLLVEVHYEPEKALSDGEQALKPEQFAELIREIAVIAQAIGRGLMRSGCKHVLQD